MRKIAHIINPCIVPESSDLFIAQPITFESLLRARKFAKGTVDVHLLSAQFQEDRKFVPSFFDLTHDLSRSVLDIADVTQKRKLPLLCDIIDRLYQYSKDADYLIYTNVDIGVQQNFYIEVNRLIEQGLDAFVITRRTIGKTYTDPLELEMMYREKGKPHPGHDCFIFSKSLYQKFNLGNACIGAAWFDKLLLWNIIAYSYTFAAYKQLSLTFHLGDDKAWKNPVSKEFSRHNRQEAANLISHLEKSIGPTYKNKKLWPYVRHVYRKLGFAVPFHHEMLKRVI